jgi:hypothetical protein
MLTRIYQRLGTAGFIISIVALVAALGGGAYAASGGLSSKQKKEVQKIAQTEAKKFAGKQGAAGATGPQGAAGPKGDPGAAGLNGGPGEKGASGEKGDPGNQGLRGPAGPSPEVVELPADPSAAECKAGGAKILGADGEEVTVCNGEGGGGGEGFPETLPSGKTETGLWEVLGENGVAIPGVAVITQISYPIRLAAVPTEGLLIDPRSASQEEKAKCPGSVAEPEAEAAGVLCLYSEGNLTGEPLTLNSAGLLKAGANVFFADPEKAVGFGSWAIKAP